MPDFTTDVCATEFYINNIISLIRRQIFPCTHFSFTVSYQD